MGWVLSSSGIVRNGDHRDGAVLADLTPRALVHRRKVGVEVARIAAASGDLLLRRADLAQRLGVVRDIRQDDEHVHPAVEGEILRGGERHARRCDTLNGGVVGKVREEHRAVDGAGALEFVDEVLRLFKCDADGGEHDGKVALAVQHLCLPRGSARQAALRQARAGRWAASARAPVCFRPSMVEMPVWMNSLG